MNVFHLQELVRRIVTASWRDEEGQTMAEYGILIGVIAIVVVAAAVFLGGSITSLFRSTGSHL